MRSAFKRESGVGATDARMWALCVYRIRSCDMHNALVLEGVRENATDESTHTAADA